MASGASRLPLTVAFSKIFCEGSQQERSNQEYQEYISEQEQLLACLGAMHTLHSFGVSLIHSISVHIWHVSCHTVMSKFSLQAALDFQCPMSNISGPNVF